MPNGMLTVRGDKKELGQLFVGSRAVLWTELTFSKNDPKLAETLLSFGEFGHNLLQKAKDCEVVTIKDEYKY